MSTPTIPPGCRKITYHERFSVTRANTGFPPAVCIISSYPSTSSLPSSTALASRIAELQTKFPLLSAQPRETRTSSPYWSPRETWDASRILVEKTSPPSSVGYGSESADKAELLRAEISSLEGDMIEGIEEVPLWRVTRYSSDAGPAYLAMTISHVLADGIGSLRLAHLLTASEETISALPTESIGSITRIEEGITVTPSLSFILPLAARELLLPQMPSFVRSYFTPPPSWPTPADVGPKPTTCPETYSLLHIPASIAVPLKLSAKASGVRTIHPVLKTAFAVAAWSIHTPGRSDIVYKASSPRSERNPSLGHSYCTANYVTSFDTHLTIRPTDDFWHLARDVAKQMDGPGPLAHARYRIGSLSYIPDKPTYTSTDPRRPTGWEDFFLTKAEGHHPYSSGCVSVSNLGLTEVPPGAEDVFWSHSPTPFSDVYSVSAIGTVRGISAVTSWRDGSVVTRDIVKKLEEAVIAILQGIVKDGASTNVGELTGLN